MNLLHMCEQEQELESKESWNSSPISNRNIISDSI